MFNVHVMNKTQKSGSERMELLVSKEVDATSGIPRLTSRMKLLLILLVSTIIALALSMFAVLRTADSAEKIQEIGLERVANSLENILSLLAIPLVLFLILFLAFICQQIYREYRSVYNPKIYGRSRKRQDD